MPKRKEYCQRCSKEFDFKDREYCWYCSGILCSDCWEDFGHCGHKAAEDENERLKVKPVGDYKLRRIDLSALAWYNTDMGKIIRVHFRRNEPPPQAPEEPMFDLFSLWIPWILGLITFLCMALLTLLLWW